MDAKAFWEVIDTAREEAGLDDNAFMSSLAHKLQVLPDEALIGFDHQLQQQMDRAYTSDLWGAAYVINGGCSDDGFAYFRGWLIAQGSQVFEMAVRNPETLAFHLELRKDEGLPHRDLELEDLLYLGVEAMGERDLELPDVESENDLSIEFDWSANTVEAKFPRIMAVLN